MREGSIFRETNETKRTIDIKTILIGVLAILIFVAIILLLTPAKEPEKEEVSDFAEWNMRL